MIGNGHNINPWTDPWLPNMPDGQPRIKPEASRENIMRVSDLKIPRTNDWNIRLLNSLFEEDSVKAICDPSWPDIDTEDKLIWRRSNNGLFSINSSCGFDFSGE